MQPSIHLFFYPSGVTLTSLNTKPLFLGVNPETPHSQHESTIKYNIHLLGDGVRIVPAGLRGSQHQQAGPEEEDQPLET